MKTLAELEAENPDDFRNPKKSPEQEAADDAAFAAKSKYEESRLPFTAQTEPDEDEEENDDEA